MLQVPEAQLAQVRELYARCTVHRDAEALRALQRLVEGRQSAAACVALAKVRQASLGEGGPLP
jgi:hypothetical protein